MIVSKGHKALTLKNSYILNTKNYESIYGNKKRNAEYRKATVSNNETMPRTSETVPASAFPDNSIPQGGGNVKNLANTSEQTNDRNISPRVTKQTVIQVYFTGIKKKPCLYYRGLGSNCPEVCLKMASYIVYAKKVQMSTLNLKM